MSRGTRGGIGALALLLATAAAQPVTASTEPPRVAKGAKAEIQIGLCAPADRIVQALGLRPRGAPITVWYFDDTALTLFGRGLRLRLRVAAQGRSEFTLKVADQDCARLDPKLAPLGEGKCEYDVHGTRTTGAMSLTRSLSARSTNDLLADRITPTQALSASQIRYLREVVGIWPLPSGIRGLGPMRVEPYRSSGGPYDVDISKLPGGEQFAEISRKVPVADALRDLRVLESDLSRSGVEMCADQTAQAVNKLRSMLR